MINTILIGVHIVVSVLLIISILLHSGKGGGMSEMFGGGQSLAAGSTVVEKNLDRLSIVLSLVFVFTTIMLAIRLQ